MSFSRRSSFPNIISFKMQTIKEGISRLLKPSTGGSTSPIAATLSTATSTSPVFSTNPCYTCDDPCSAHEQLPLTMAKRIDQGPMLHSFKPYFHHLLLRSGTSNSWPERVEEETESLAEIYSKKLGVSKKRIMVTVFDENDSLSLLSPESTKALIFPAGLQVSEELVSIANGAADKLVDVLLASAQVDHVPSNQSLDLESLSLPEIPTSIKSFVLVCAHMKRDKKCGVAGPMLIKEFKKSLKERGLAVPTLAISHIGGHKYAGNVIVYNRDPNDNKAFIADWYGRVKTCHVQSIIEESILSGKVIKELWRGRMANPSDPTLEW